jgi:hypothetical protein
MLNTIADGHKLLSSALDVAVKVHALLPDGVTLKAWTVLPFEVSGQVASLDDDTAIGWVVWISQQPGWQFEESLLKHSDFLPEPYVAIAAITDVDGMQVRIWAHVTADAQKAAISTMAERSAAMAKEVAA